MLRHLHANATTTPKTRAYIQASASSVTSLAAELGVSQTTIRRWRGRTSPEVSQQHHTTTNPGTVQPICHNRTPGQARPDFPTTAPSPIPLAFRLAPASNGPVVRPPDGQLIGPARHVERPSRWRGQR